MNISCTISSNEYLISAIKFLGSEAKKNEAKEINIYSSLNLNLISFALFQKSLGYKA